MHTISERVDPDRAVSRIAGPQEIRGACERAKDEVHRAARDHEMLQEELGAALRRMALGNGDEDVIEEIEAEIEKVTRRRRRWTVAVHHLEGDLGVPTRNIRGDITSY